jgi:hypothetical protein
MPTTEEPVWQTQLLMSVTVRTLRQLVDQLDRDPWREERPFSADLLPAQERILDAATPGEAASELLGWLASSQPCLFGRRAAKVGALEICVLQEWDVNQGDEHVRLMIQDHRQAWREDALEGAKSGYVILLASEAVAQSEPNQKLLALAKRLLWLYLTRRKVDEINLDDIFLQIRRDDGTEAYRQWKVGVNFFGSQADQRWWHDHRIPGGIALSMNSVGHMARSLLERSPDSLRSNADRGKLVGWALPVAMQTILGASKNKLGLGGTRLLEREEAGEMDVAPFATDSDKFRNLQRFSHRKYRGRYHTDETIPSSYFRAAESRPNEFGDYDLDFSYLHDQSEEDYRRMGLGEEAEPEVAGILGRLLAEASDDGE